MLANDFTKSKVLSGIRVIEWAAWHQGPEAASMLGDLGADVIKIEDRIRGDPFRGVESLSGTSMTMPKQLNMAFQINNRNKRSITLDLKKDKGKQVLGTLVSKSDVFLTNYSQSTAKKLGVDYESLKAYNPHLIYAIGSGLGTRGPESERPSFDIIAQGRSGIMFMTSDRDHTEPYQIVGGIIDQVGAMVLAFGVVSALLARERSGIAQRVEGSLLGSAIYAQLGTVAQFLLMGKVRARHSRTRAKNPLTNQYKCADGKWIILAAFQSDRFWQDFCRAVNLERLVEDVRFKGASERSANRRELISILDGIFATKPRAEWLAIFNEKCPTMPVGPILEISDLATDSQVLANEYIREYDHPVLGKIKVVGCPMYFDQTPTEMRLPAPAFGQHTEEVLQEICGYSWPEIIRLKEEEVV